MIKAAFAPSEPQSPAATSRPVAPLAYRSGGRVSGDAQ
jgi:hypothetical protein